MIDTVLERPISVGIIGGIFSIAALWLWLQTSMKPLLYLGLASILLTFVATSSGISIETPLEQLLRYLEETAAELQKNEIDKVIAKIHPAATFGLRELETTAQSLQFEIASIKKIHQIIIAEGKPSPKAIVKCNVFVELIFQGSRFKIPRYVELTLYQVDGKWLVYDVIHKEPTYGFKKHDE